MKKEMTKERMVARAELISEKFHRLSQAMDNDDNELCNEMLYDLQRLFPEFRENLSRFI